MSLIRSKFKDDLSLLDIFPEQWKDSLPTFDSLYFSNLDQFTYVVSKLTQKDDSLCGVNYCTALDDLIHSRSDLTKDETTLIRNTVRENLLKRGLITEEVYENYRYSADGTQVGIDVGKYCSGDPDCVITPSKQYIDYFYELYVNISYSCYVENEEVRHNVIKLLSTVEELERQHIFIKITAVFPGNNCTAGSRFFSILPLFSHKENKSVEKMASVINDRLLRKFYFAILEDYYGDKLSSNYGTVIQLPKTINIGNELDEIELFEQIKNEVTV